jgi:hypothetical protein
MKKLIYLIPISILFLGCSNKMDEKLLAGKYAINQKQSDYIILDKNHSYVHKYISFSGKIYECNGHWRYNGQEIAFDDFVFFNDTGPSAGEGTWFSKVEKRDNSICLIYSSENDVYYKKQK